MPGCRAQRWSSDLSSKICHNPARILATFLAWLAKQPDSQRPRCGASRHTLPVGSVAWILLGFGGERDVKGDMEMTQTQPQSEVAVNARLLKIGLEVFPVYGDEKSGFSVDPGDLYPQMPIWFRYRSLDELFFALVNLNISTEGQA
jgi:hypothetical protein